MQAQQQLQVPPQAQMMQMVTGFWNACCIYAAAKLNIPDLIAASPKTAEQLAKETNTHAPSLYRVLRALNSTGIFNQNEKNEFSNTTLGETLRSDVPGSMKAMVIAQLGDHYGAWGNLLYSIKTGGIAFDNLHGMSVWKYYESHPEDGVNFMKAMSGLTMGAIMNVLPAYNFTAFKTIADIGGGIGTFLCAILKNTPGATGIVLDEPYLQPQANQNISDSGMQSRCTFTGGNFFEGINIQADCYVMKMILHDWNDEQSAQILANVYKAMPAGSKLLIVESVIDESNAPNPGKFMDINMLAMTGGRERTANEWKTLLQKAGLNFIGITPTHSPVFNIIESVKA